MPPCAQTTDRLPSTRSCAVSTYPSRLVPSGLDTISLSNTACSPNKVDHLVDPLIRYISHPRSVKGALPKCRSIGLSTSYRRSRIQTPTFEPSRTMEQETRRVFTMPRTSFRSQFLLTTTARPACRTVPALSVHEQRWKLMPLLTRTEPIGHCHRSVPKSCCTRPIPSPHMATRHDKRVFPFAIAFLPHWNRLTTMGLFSALVGSITIPCHHRAPHFHF